VRLLPSAGSAAPTFHGVAELPAVFPVSASVEARAMGRAPVERDRALRARLLEALGRRRKKLARLIVAVEGDRARLITLAEEGRRGELLKGALGRIARGATQIVVDDYETGEPVVVPLDPALGPKENLVRFFARARKAARGLPIVDQRLARLAAERASLDAERASIEGASGEELLARAASADGGALEGVRLASVEGAVDPRSRAPRSHPLDAWSRRFVALDGAEIRVGKGARENDRLTLSGARGDDVWLHASGSSGAHVVLRNEKGRSPHPEALLDAATLAAYHSGARREAKVEVVWTEARHVKKSKGDPPGRVSVAKGRTLLVSLDPARLDRLLGRDPGAAPR
jgi:predicted ribosome quality control (RQC) complex YloA/Tae2 family protein